MCEKTSVVEQLNMSLRELARADFKSLHQQRPRGEETIWSLLKLKGNTLKNIAIVSETTYTEKGL